MGSHGDRSDDVVYEILDRFIDSIDALGFRRRRVLLSRMLQCAGQALPGLFRGVLLPKKLQACIVFQLCEQRARNRRIKARVRETEQDQPTTQFAERARCPA
jgi:hypothetical protein